jgi:hypothetical protein
MADERRGGGNPNIAELGMAYRFKPGNTLSKGRQRGSLLKRLVERLDARSDLLDAVQVIEAAETQSGLSREEIIERWTAETLTNGDLVIEAMLGIALNRNGRVPYLVQLQAQTYIFDRMHGKVTDKTPPAIEDESQRPLMSVEEFRRAIAMPDVPPAPAAPDDGSVIIDVTAVPVETDDGASGG